MGSAILKKKGQTYTIDKTVMFIIYVGTVQILIYIMEYIEKKETNLKGWGSKNQFVKCVDLTPYIRGVFWPSYVMVFSSR